VGIRINVQSTIKTNELTDGIVRGAQRGVMLAAHRLLALSTEGVPEQDGTLKNSAAVVTPSDDQAGVVYDTPYAKRLHENPQYNFSKDENPNARGKWLELAADENRAELGDIIRTEARRG
jgi:hypothetical protein